MNYFLGVEVTQNDRAIFIKQQRYVAEILSRFGMEESKPLNNPVVVGSKLTRNDEEKRVDPTLFK